MNNPYTVHRDTIEKEGTCSWTHVMTLAAATVAPELVASKEKGASPHQTLKQSPPTHHSKRRKQDRRLTFLEKDLLEHTLDPKRDLISAALGAEKSARYRKWFQAHLGILVLMMCSGNVLNFLAWFKVDGYEYLAIASGLMTVPFPILAVLTHNQKIMKQLLLQFDWWYINNFVWLTAFASGDVFSWDYRAFPTILNPICAYLWATSTDAKMGRSRSLAKIKTLGFGVCTLYMSLVLAGIIFGWFPDLRMRTLVNFPEIYVTNVWLLRVSCMEGLLFVCRILFIMVRKPGQMGIVKFNMTVRYQDHQEGTTLPQSPQSESSRRSGIDSRTTSFSVKSSTVRNLSVYNQIENGDLGPADTLVLLFSFGNTKFSNWVRSTFKIWNAVFSGMYLAGFLLHVVAWFQVPGYTFLTVLSVFLFLPHITFTVLLYNRQVVGELMKQFNFWYLNINALQAGLAAGAIFKWDARAFSIITLVFLYYTSISLMDAKLGRSRSVKNHKKLALVCGMIYAVLLVLGIRFRWFPGLQIESPIVIVEEVALSVTAGGVFYFRAWLATLFLLRYFYHAMCHPNALVVLNMNGTVAYNKRYEVKTIQVQPMTKKETEDESAATSSVKSV